MAPSRPLLAALFLASLALAPPAAAQDAAADSAAAEEGEWDVATADLGPTRTFEATLSEGTWMSLDLSPDGRTLVFDLLGDLWSLPVEGGEATRLRGGRAWEIQPRFSPDGEWISFTSDAGGGDNIWVMRADGSDARQVTDESFRLLSNAAWHPDGRTLVARKHFTSRRSLGAGEMWMYDSRAGGSGVQLTERPTDQKDVGEPEFSPDGRYLYYSLDSTPGERFEYNKDPNGTIYTIRRLDLHTGETETTVRVQGGSVRPEISPDGTRLAHVRRVRGRSVLVVRELATGIDTPLFDGLSQDQQETWAIHGVYPNFAWSPDGAAIYIYGQGQLHRVDSRSGESTVVPFTAAVSQEITEAVRFHPDFGGDTLDVKVVRWPRVSPDGRRVVFQALGQLYVRELAGGEARRVTDADHLEFHPAWAPDSRTIVYTSWDDQEGGRVRTVRADGSRARVVVDRPGHYAEPGFGPRGEEIVYRRVGGDGYRGDRWSTDTGVYLVPAAGGEPRLVREGGTNPRLVDGGQRIQLLDLGGTKRLYTVDRNGQDEVELATSERAMEMLPSPDGRWIAFTELWEVYVAPLPRAGKAVAVGPKMGNLPVRKLSGVGGEFLGWSADGNTLRFGLAADFHEVDVPPLFAAGGDTLEVERRTTRLGFTVAAGRPSTDVAFVGAKVLTMDDAGAIEDGVVRVRGNRIVAVGAREEVDTAGAEIVDVAGKVLMPGLVDIHAHMGSSNHGMHAQANWAYLANLAFGVTTTHDPSNNTSMVFASHELVDSGKLVGPRVFSTGTILYGAEGDFKAPIDTREDARRHLQRLKAYGAFSVKSYNQPRRDQRQWVIAEARDLQMMVVPEGGSTFQHNMNMVVDGHTTIEHAIPLAPLHEDCLQLIAGSGTAYTPTLVVGYGGLWGENYWYMVDDVWEHERLLQWVPRAVVDSRSRRRVKVPEEELHHIRLAQTAAEIVRRGGVAELGAHGQLQGLGVHWEMWMFGQGGLSNLDALRVGTILGARSLGLDHEIGSVTEGKLADLIVLAADPTEDLRHSEQVDLVMVDGRLYDARSMEQLAPGRAPAPALPAVNDLPRDWWTAGCLPGDDHRH